MAKATDPNPTIRLHELETDWMREEEKQRKLAEAELKKKKKKKNVEVVEEEEEDIVVAPESLKGNIVWADETPRRMLSSDGKDIVFFLPRAIPRKEAVCYSISVPFVSFC